MMSVNTCYVIAEHRLTEQAVLPLKPLHADNFSLWGRNQTFLAAACAWHAEEGTVVPGGRP